MRASSDHRHRKALILAALLPLLGYALASIAAAQGAYARLEASFELPGVTGNPFNYLENDVQVGFKRPDGRRAVVPAFFDGESTWRVRFTPDMPGRYRLEAVTLNGRDASPRSLDRREFIVSGKPSPGFIRVDPKGRMRFVFSDGQPYYPFGCNVAWSSRTLDVPGHLARLGQAGVNWSRIWMTHFDSRNLDWEPRRRLPVGNLSLEAARKWDAIVDAAEQQGIYFQMVLQHHGQYSTRTDSNWRSHPWNKANGGWLDSAAGFFTDPRALALTRAKYRYIVARWGYSPAIMAWELFNEVQYVDAVRTQPEAVTRWHSEMAAFIRQQDPYHHLITTSSDLSLDIWRDMDYYQAHTYPPEPLTGIAAAANRKLDKPFFLGEMGPAPMGSMGLGKDDGSFLHPAIWVGLMSQMAGAAQYWEWSTVNKNDLYGHFQAASAFLKQSQMAAADELRAVSATVETPERGTLRLAPPAAWGIGNRAELTIEPNGEAPGIDEMQTMLHGANHKNFPTNFTFHVDYAAPGTFTADIGTVSRNGARVRLSVDGKSLVERDFPRAERDTRINASFEARITAGKHTVTLCNSGRDWVLVNSIELSPYAPALGVIGKSNNRYAVLWLYRRPGSPGEVKGALVVPGLEAGNYIATWWDTHEGKPLNETRARLKSGQLLRLDMPPVARDVAVWIKRQ